MSAERYYAIPVTTVFKTYSVTTPAASLLEREPEIVRFDAGTLRTKEDWIAAGKAVFEWPENKIPAGRDPLDTNRVVIRAKGMIEYGSASCSSCHERHLASGEIIPGAQLHLERRWRRLPFNCPRPGT